jgi:hypothetical protein
MSSFMHPFPEKFEVNIENRLITKQILSSQKEQFPPPQIMTVSELNSEDDGATVLLERFNTGNVPARPEVISEKVKTAMNGTVPAEKGKEISENDSPQISQLLDSPRELQIKDQAAADQLQSSTGWNVDTNVSPSRDKSIQQPLLSSTNQPMPPLGFSYSAGMNPRMPLLQPSHPTLQNIRNQLSLMLKHERSCLLQRQKALDGEDMTKFPINVQDNFRQQKDLLQRQMSLLEDQTRLLSELFHSQVPLINPHAFPPSRPVPHPFRNVSFPSQPHTIRGPVFPLNVARMPMGYAPNLPAASQPYLANSLAVKEPHGVHDLNWDDL